ncbi:MAG: mechanosensitive ion channel family protein [Deltaproteobacteria bacterium]|nr:mechanosensitive ion channel family protein [Deltaproteobacteria bacterium]
MTFTDALLAEAKGSWLGWAFLTLVVTLLLGRALPGRAHRRLPASVWLFAVQLVLLVVVALLVTLGNDADDEARLAQRVILAMAWVGMGGALVFGVILPRTRFPVSRILQDLVVGAAAIAVIAAVLHNHGVALAGLFATSAVVTAVIGFSLQDTLGNTIGGLALQTDGSVRVGDWIKVGEVAGKVTEIRWRYTAIETRNWETVLLPNSTLMKGPVTVLGRRHGEPELWRRWVWFNVDFRYPPPDVIGAVEGALRAQPIDNVAASPQPNCILMDLHESYGRYAVRYWLKDLAVDDPTDSAVRTRVMYALRRADIPLSIPAHALFVTEESAERKESKSASDKQRRTDALHKVELFAPLEDAELERLADALHPAPFTKGEVLTRQGAEAHWLYLLITGEAAVRVAKDGIETEVARIGAGSFFGEMSLMTGEPRSATVVALSDVECYRLDAAAFRDLLERRPQLAEPIARLLAERRANLAAVTEGLDAEARRRKMESDSSDLFKKMKAFFKL